MKKGISAMALILVLAVVLIATGALQLGQIGAVAPAGITTPTPASAGIACQTDGTNTLNVANRNKLATTASLNIRSTAVAVGNDGAFVTSGTTDGAATLAYTALSIDCAPNKITGNVYVISGTAAPDTLVNSVKGTYDLSNKLSDSALLQGSNTTSLTMVIRDTSLVNLSDLTAGTANSANDTTAVTMGASAIRSGYFDVTGTTGASQFGSDELGLLWVVDTSDSSVFSDNALSLSSGQIALASVACPADVLSFDSANRCYKSGAIKTSDGLIRVSFSLSSDLGNPGSSADPRVYVEDIQYFLEDGVIKTGVYNKAGTNLGTARQQFGLDIS